MPWIIGSFFLIFTQICLAVAYHNKSDLVAYWKENLTSENLMNITPRNISGIKVKANWFGDEASSGNVVLNKTFIETMESANEVKARNESFSSLLHTKLDDEDEDKERRARGTTLKVTHSGDEATTYSPVLNHGHLDAHEEDNSIFIMNPEITTKKYRAQVTNTLPTPWIRHVSGDNLHLDYFDHNNMNYTTGSPLHVCFATNSHLYPEESELPTCESMEMEEEIVECDLPVLSCRNRCQEDFYGLHVNPDSSCYCGARCLVYNSCCEDFEEQCPGTYVEGKEQLDLFEGKQAVCSKYVRAMLIAHCPRDTPDEQLRNQCENPDLSRIAHLFPVTDSVSGHHFQNIYCWKCWSMTGDVVHWEAVIRFNGENAHKNEYDREPMVSIIVNETWRVFWLAPSENSLFYCESCAVSRCTGCRHADETKRKRCSSLNSVVEIDDITYANKYCYTCSQEYLDTHNSEKTFRNDNLAQCRIPPVPDQEKYENVISYHTFNFYVIASVTEETMLLQTDYSPLVTFLWSSMNCTDDAPKCDVIECRPSFQLDSHQCAPPRATEEGAMQIKLIFRPSIKSLPDLSPFPKLSVSVMEVFDTLKQLCEESIEQEFQSSKFAVKNWVTDVLNMALYLQYESADDLYEIAQYLTFKTFLLVKTTEALNIHKVPGITDICVGQFENGLPIPLDPLDCIPYGSHLGSRASSLLSVPKSLMWTNVFLYLASF